MEQIVSKLAVMRCSEESFLAAHTEKSIQPHCTSATQARQKKLTPATTDVACRRCIGSGLDTRTQNTPTTSNQEIMPLQQTAPSQSLFRSFCLQERPIHIFRHAWQVLFDQNFSFFFVYLAHFTLPPPDSRGGTYERHQVNLFFFSLNLPRARV